MELHVTEAFLHTQYLVVDTFSVCVGQCEGCVEQRTIKRIQLLTMLSILDVLYLKMCRNGSEQCVSD